MSSGDPWERHAGWWQQKFTDGVDPEYEEQLLPLVDEYLAGANRVVDVGCGEGQVARRIAELGAEVVGIDPTAAQVTVARERGGGPRYARAGAEALPLRDASFDAAVSNWERSRDTPRVDSLARILEACGFEADMTFRRLDDVDRAQIRENLAMTPAERLESVRNVSKLRAKARPIERQPARA